MNIGVIGAGFVGVPLAGVLAEKGQHVMVVDIDPEKVATFSSGTEGAIDELLYEPDLARTIVSERYTGRLRFSLLDDGGRQGLSECKVIFMCVNTPPGKGGATDLTYLDKAFADVVRIKQELSPGKYTLLVTKSTVPRGTANRNKRRIADLGMERCLGVASSPEFLAESTAMRDSRSPSKVVVGAYTERDFTLMRAVYEAYRHSPNITYLEVNPSTAEFGKYLSNVLLMGQILAMMETAGRAAEIWPDVDYWRARDIAIADSRIFRWGGYPTLYAGGSCFPKDLASLIAQLEAEGVDPIYLKALRAINTKQRYSLLKRAVAAGFDFTGKTVAVLGLSFKKDTNDVRESVARYVIPRLLRMGVTHLRAFDPKATANARRIFDPATNGRFRRISYHPSSLEALEGSDACIILTDWEEFRGLAGDLEEGVDPPYWVLDGRRMISDETVRDLVEQGFTYLPVAGALMRG